MAETGEGEKKKIADPEVFVLDYKLRVPMLEKLKFGEHLVFPTRFVTVINGMGIGWKTRASPKGLVLTNTSKEERSCCLSVIRQGPCVLLKPELGLRFRYDSDTRQTGASWEELEKEDLSDEILSADTWWVSTFLDYPDTPDQKKASPDVFARTVIVLDPEQYRPMKIMDQLIALEEKDWREPGPLTEQLWLRQTTAGKSGSAYADVVLHARDGRLWANFAVLTLRCEYFAKLFPFNSSNDIPRKQARLERSVDFKVLRGLK